MDIIFEFSVPSLLTRSILREWSMDNEFSIEHFIKLIFEKLIFWL